MKCTKCGGPVDYDNFICDNCRNPKPEFDEDEEWRSQNWDKEVPQPKNPTGGSKWRRYRFQTKSVDDYRPIVFIPKYPWWCSGQRADGSSATIIAFLPVEEDLKKYWDDAFDIEFTEHDTITFSERFPKPSYFIE